MHTRRLLLLAIVVISLQVVAAQAQPSGALSAEEAKQLEDARTEARRQPDVREEYLKYVEARKGHYAEREKFPNDRSNEPTIAFRKAEKQWNAILKKAVIAKHPELAALIEKEEAAARKPAHQKNEGETIADSDDPHNRAIRPIKDDSKLPRVLLIGDSISIGYTLDVRERLKGKANVHRIPQNGGATEVGLEKMAAWLGDGHWDVIHFNFGLHDAKYQSATELRTTLDEYAANLQTLIDQMKKSGDKLIFATTTPVPKDGKLSPGRVFDDIPTRNEVARKVMAKNGVAIDDLYTVVKNAPPEIGRENDVHFTPEGYVVLGKAVAASIAERLPKK